jgi:hypothetical protein
MFTAAFGVAKQLVPTLSQKDDDLRFILMEKPATEELRKTLTATGNCIISYGAVLGEMYRFKNGKPVARQPTSRKQQNLFEYPQRELGDASDSAYRFSHHCRSEISPNFRWGY